MCMYHVSCISIHFFLLSNNIHYIDIPHFVYPSLEGHLGCYHFLPVLSNADMNIGI